jgi:hypothetical protein
MNKDNTLLIPEKNSPYYFIDTAEYASYDFSHESNVIGSIPRMKRQIFLPSILMFSVLVFLLITLCQPIAVFSSTDDFNSLKDAAMKLVQMCEEPKAGLDDHAVATLVDYVLTQKKNVEYALPKSQGCTGAYYEFDTKITFPRFIEYSYSPFILSVITRPSSLRYSYWATAPSETQRLPAGWKPALPGGAPVIIHGMERDSNSPDLNTGVYHEYDMKRTLVLLNYKGRQVLFSVSKQAGKSNVGKKGYILGSDTDWSYYYTAETGSTMTGLGWAKSYIYDYFSVSVYVESGGTPTMVRTGVFQWLQAGWSGINFVNSGHILRGLKRFGRDCKMVLESPRLPAPNKILSVYQSLSNMPTEVLTKRYGALRQAQRSSAVKIGKIGKSEGEEEVSFANTPKEQMVEELMLEYLKTALGKATLLRGEWEGPSTIQ